MHQMTRQYPQARRPAPVNPNFHYDMLQLHNKLRAKHCAPPLTISQELNQIAQSYAEHLAATSRFEHSHNTFRGQPLGENLYTSYISYGQARASAADAVYPWYNEIKSYNFRRPTFSSKTGHFSQLVWKSSRLLGIGIAHSPNKQQVYIVANYFPAGNVVGQGFFERNVLPSNC